MDIVVTVTYLRHLHKTYQQEHGHNHQSDNQVGRYQHTEVGIFQGLKLRIAQQRTFVTAHRIQSGLDKVHGHKHTDDGTAGVEALRQVQSSGSRLLWSHRQDVGVA